MLRPVARSARATGHSPATTTRPPAGDHGPPHARHPASARPETPHGRANSPARRGGVHPMRPPPRPLSDVRSSLFPKALRSEEHTSELQSLMRISYAVFCLKKTKQYRSPANKRTTSLNLHL